MAVEVSNVAPLVGAWIEIKVPDAKRPAFEVAPLVGAWIEINEDIVETSEKKSLPLWERGLKLLRVCLAIERDRVAPLVGAWIEIL